MCNYLVIEVKFFGKPQWQPSKQNILLNSSDFWCKLNINVYALSIILPLEIAQPKELYFLLWSTPRLTAKSWDTNMRVRISKNSEQQKPDDRVLHAISTLHAPVTI